MHETKHTPLLSIFQQPSEATCQIARWYLHFFKKLSAFCYFGLRIPQPFLRPYLIYATLTAFKAFLRVHFYHPSSSVRSIVWAPFVCSWGKPTSREAKCLALILQLMARQVNIQAQLPGKLSMSF